MNTTETKEKKPLLGILGGVGPLSSAYLYELITSHTPASRDQEHIDLILSSRASTPDRTAFIIGESNADPSEVLVSDAKKLVAFGATYLAIACNTAHYFYDRIRGAVDVPVLNIMEETVKTIDRLGIRKVGLLATTGTVRVRVYQDMCEKHGIECVTPDEENQKNVMEMIYGSVKSGKKADPVLFGKTADSLREQGCEKIILGCTELSLIKKEEGLDTYYLDALEVLASRAIEMAGKKPMNFSF